MNYKHILLGGLGLAGCLANTETASAQKKAEKPNIVLIVSDDHGMKDAGCYGHPIVKTPNIDALAAAGTRFNYAFCTSASCSASRSVLLTGLHNHANGQYGHDHDFHHFRTFDDIESLPVSLRKGGYTTARIGKYHIGPEEVYHFDVALPGDCRSPVEMAEICRNFISDHRDKPFFLYYCTCDPHRGAMRNDLPLKPNGFGNRKEGYVGVEEVSYDPDNVYVPNYLPDTPETRAELAQYYQSVSRMDQGVGQLIKILKETDKWDNTVIIYLSDNGIAFPGAKTNLYEPAMRLPCIVRNPYQRRQGSACNAMISWVDITPTILDFAQATPQDGSYHGRSFKTAMKDENPEGWDQIYASHTFHEVTMYYPMRVIRGRKYKLIWNIAHGLDYPHASDLWESPTWQSALKSEDGQYGPRSIAAYNKRPPFELYNLENDPMEINNLANNPASKPILEDLKLKLKQFQKTTKDPWIVKWDHE